MIYAYIRISSSDQNLDRQYEAIKKWEKENNLVVDEIFEDKQSGKNFERENYQKMKSLLKEGGKDFNRTNYKKLCRKLKAGDVLFIKSIDRLGRNYDMIIEEWTNITKNIKSDIVVMDMPLLDTREKNDNLTGKLISDIVLQLLSYVAQIERENIKQRQAEGIKIAKEKGVHFGRKAKYDDEFIEKIKVDYLRKIPLDELVEKYGCSKDRIVVWARKGKWKELKKKQNAK